MRQPCRRQLAALGVALASVCFWAGPAAADVVPPRAAETGMLIVTAPTAEIHEGPSSRSDVLTVVEQGEVFQKEGRTGAWYYIRIGEDSVGWISGRAVSRYRGEPPSTTTVVPEERRTYPYVYVGPGYDPYYPYWDPFWEGPYLSWDWYWYGGDRRYWDRDRHRHGDHDHDWDDRVWRDDRHRRYESTSPGVTVQPHVEEPRREGTRERVFVPGDSGRHHEGGHVPAPRMRGPFRR